MTAQPSRLTTPSSQCESFTCARCTQPRPMDAPTRSSVRTVPCSEPAGASPAVHARPSASTMRSAPGAKPPPRAGGGTAASKVSVSAAVVIVSTEPSTARVKRAAGSARCTAKNVPASWKRGGLCGDHSMRISAGASTVKRAAPCSTTAPAGGAGSYASTHAGGAGAPAAARKSGRGAAGAGAGAAAPSAATLAARAPPNQPADAVGSAARSSAA
jgi:hypothetical protein